MKEVNNINNVGNRFFFQNCDICTKILPCRLKLNLCNNIKDKRYIFFKNYKKYDSKWINSTKTIANKKQVFKRTSHRSD